MGGTRGRGIGTATPDSIAIVLSNGGLVSAGSNEARNELTQALKQWHELGQPDLIYIKPTFTPDEDGWAVRLAPPQPRSPAPSAVRELRWFP